MTINCFETTDGYVCETGDITPEYITFISTPDGGFWFNETITPTDFLLTFFGFIFLIYFITRGIFNFILRTYNYMKARI